MAEFNRISVENVTLSNDLKQKFSKASFFIGIIGFLLSFVFFMNDSHHFYFSYLVSFAFFMTLTLGALFFVLMQHVTRAGWSVVVRRIPEILTQNFLLMSFFFLPILLGAHDIYHWTHLEEVQKDHLLQVKYPYLNFTFFLIRSLIYFISWYFISKLFFKKSVSQDTVPNTKSTLFLQKISTVCIIIFALTLTFAFIDWIMSITPHWYSTIFGVYFFAGSMVVFFSFLGLFFMFLRKFGYLKTIVNEEHYHDIGKFLYGFNIFWAYIAFSQYFLIWYANIPEETVWFIDHFNGSWEIVARVLAIGHFGIPFILFMSRYAKRNLKFHASVSVFLIFMHIVDLYWIIMPNINKSGIHVSVIDIAPFLAIGGIYFGFFFLNLGKYCMVPINDPRISESLKFHNH